ncbi:hypothetical protein QO002_005834 [Pararhizobium capsulatum DSM 1112]|uniref:Uncharacterized protein n=1 Tax=Pararhizobium capsulatum DSM 1112 TaxID=1121113 RepID=A0ABU0C0A3_9HYPH|nr:hypothetical protein [Pararhizobium capsulatum DSM 1112]
MAETKVSPVRISRDRFGIGLFGFQSVPCGAVKFGQIDACARKAWIEINCLTEAI